MKFLRMPDLNEMQESGQPVMNGEGEPDNPVMPSISQSMLHDLGVDQDREHEDRWVGAEMQGGGGAVKLGKGRWGLLWKKRGEGALQT